MAIVFYYDESALYWIESIISACFLIIINLFIRKSGKSQPEGIKHSRLLVLASDINIIILIVKLFIPRLNWLELSGNGWFFCKMYHLITQLIVPISSLITFGIFFVIFGSKNRGKYKNIPLVAGITMSINRTIQIANLIFFWYFLIDYYVLYPGFSIEDHLPWTIYLISINIPITANLLWVVFLYGHAKFNKDKYLHYAMIIMVFNLIVMGELWVILRTIFQP